MPMPLGFPHCLFFSQLEKLSCVLSQGQSLGLPSRQQASAQPTDLRLTLAKLQPVICAVSYCATLHSPKLRCTLLSYAAPLEATLRSTEQCCNLLICPVSYCSTLHPPKLRCTLLSYAAPSLSTLHPPKLRCTRLSNAAPS
jgi:hypothetical protein